MADGSTTCFWCHTIIHVRHALTCPSCSATILQRAVSGVTAHHTNFLNSGQDIEEVESQQRLH